VVAGAKRLTASWSKYLAAVGEVEKAEKGRR
jgi:hypothetical protein